MNRRIFLSLGAIGLVVFALYGITGLSQDLSGILPQNDLRLKREAQFFVNQGTTRVLVVEAEIDSRSHADALRPATRADSERCRPSSRAAAQRYSSTRAPPRLPRPPRRQPRPSQSLRPPPHRR